MAVINGVEVGSGNDLLNMPEMADAPVSSQTGIAAIALNFALKYHDITTVQDGTLYQQYKMEGRNFRDLHLDEVFHTAVQIENHLLKAPTRLALSVLEDTLMAVESAFAEEDASAIETGTAETEGLGPEAESAAHEVGDAK